MTQEGMNADIEQKVDKAKFKDFKEGKEAMSVLIKKYETTRDLQKKTRRVMQEKFAARLYRIIQDPAERERLLEGFLNHQEREREEEKVQNVF